MTPARVEAMSKQHASNSEVFYTNINKNILKYSVVLFSTFRMST